MAFYSEKILDTVALCEGYDGIGLGVGLLEPAYRNICGVEREIFPVVNMVKKTEKIFMDEKPQWSDVSSFRIPRLRGLVDCITAGIPCQPFSCAGKQRGLDDVRWIWPEIYEIIRDVRPRILFFEEVSGFKKHGLPILLRDIAEIGYDATWDYFRAPDVEAPHKKRERIFILARLADTESGGTGEDNRGVWKGLSGIDRRQEANCKIEELDDSLGVDRRTRTERSGWATRPDVDGTGSRAGLAFSDSIHDDDAGFGAVEVCGQQSETPEILEGMADTDCGRSRTSGPNRVGPTELQTSEKTFSNRQRTIWPAKDGEEQFRWEPPRVGISGPVEPTLGRDAYGLTSRVDELRLCGNGVLPAMAGLAWYILKSILIENGIW